jgi:myo-inositol-1(or 4)-monophosphatase
VLFHERAEFLKQVEAIARLGADELEPYWRALSPDEVSEKARNDLVSAADLASEKAIVSAINDRFPDHNVLSEEAGWKPSRSDSPTWIIDPLDGTTNFIQGIPQYAVSVGVSIADRVEFGVILDPRKDDVFTAGRGLGASWNGTPCRVSSRATLESTVLATGFPFKAHRLLDAYLDIFREVFLRCKAIRRPGAAALDLAHTACGLFDGFFEFQLSAWDIAAGSLLVEEAGGVITDMNGGSGYLESGNVVCGAPGVHRALLEVIVDHADSWRDTAG